MKFKSVSLLEVDPYMKLSVFYNLVTLCCSFIVLTLSCFMTVYFYVNSLIYNNVYIYHKTFARRLTLYTTFQSHAWNHTFHVSGPNFKISSSYLRFKEVINDENTNLTFYLHVFAIISFVLYICSNIVDLKDGEFKCFGPGYDWRILEMPCCACVTFSTISTL